MRINPLAGAIVLACLSPLTAGAQENTNTRALEQRLKAQEERLRELEHRQDEAQALKQRLEKQQKRIDELEGELESKHFGTAGSGRRGPEVAVSGFINAGFQATNLGKDGPTYRETDNELRATNFNSAGLQLDGTITDKVSGTIQFLAEGDESFDTRIEWAYLSYAFNSSIKVRAGRIVAPFYMNSQSFYVGYAHPWVEPPAEVYDTAPVRNFEGADITWQFTTGDVAHSLNAYFGSASLDAPLAGSPVTFDVHNAYGLNLSSTLGNLNTWLAYNKGDADVAMPNACFNAPSPLNAPNPPSCGLNFSQYSFENDEIYFASSGFEYDNGDILFMAEHVQTNLNGWLPKARAHYATLGYRFGSWMPHVTWASTETTSFNEVEGDPGAEILYNQQKSNQNSWTLGLRGDVAPGLAVKAEVSTYYNIGKRNTGVTGTSTDSGLFSRPIPADEDDPMVFRLSTNLVF